MPRHAHFASLPSILAVVLATPGFAEVTPEDVWAAMRAQISGYGSVSADTERDADRLTVSNINMSSDINGGISTIALSEAIVFRDQGDGTVAVEFPAELTATVTVSGEDIDAVNISYAFAQTGMNITASGTADNILHQFTAPRMAYAFNDVSIDGKEMQGNLDMVLTDTSGTWHSMSAQAQELDAQYSSAALNMSGEFTDAAGGGRVKFDAQINGLDLTSAYTLPAGFETLTPAQLLSAGVTADSEVGYADGTFAVSVTAKDTTTTLDGTLGSGSIDVGVDGALMRYTTEANDFAAAASVSNLPFPPIDVSYDRSSFDLTMPLAQTDDAQDFGLGVALQGLEVSDFVWGMLDPAQQLPRDPADVVIDLDGRGNWLVDILDPQTTATPNDATPGRLDRLTVKELQVKLAGAELTGVGDFTFDNDAPSPLGGFPSPIGQLDLALTGGITLLDKLTALGLVQQQQAMGIKMMSGLFAKQGAEPDTLTSTIEFDASGKVLANGVQLQ